jgi:galactokinase/mevalonate kinase-like predicted kinase
VKVSFSAPGRCGIIGNPSDIYGGTVVSCSTPVRAYCTLTLGESELLPDDLRLWNAATTRFPLPGPLKVEWQTDIPRSSGLSGSTALLAATLACVVTLVGQPDLLNDKVAFAELLRDVEKVDAGIMCGYQDAYMIAHGGLQILDFAGKTPAVNGGPVGNLTPVKLVDLPFLLITTGVERLSGAVHGPMSRRWLSGEKLVVDGIGRIAELGRAGASALGSSDLSTLAELMNENQRIIRELGGSGDEVDQLVKACLNNGAKAVKLAGAGLGGTVIALCEDEVDLAVRLRKLGYQRFMVPEVGEGLRREGSKR